MVCWPKFCSYGLSLFLHRIIFSYSIMSFPLTFPPSDLYYHFGTLYFLINSLTLPYPPPSHPAKFLCGITTPPWRAILLPFFNETMRVLSTFLDVITYCSPLFSSVSSFHISPCLFNTSLCTFSFTWLTSIWPYCHMASDA